MEVTEKNTWFLQGDRIPLIKTDGKKVHDLRRHKLHSLFSFRFLAGEDGEVSIQGTSREAWESVGAVYSTHLR